MRSWLRMQHSLPEKKKVAVGGAGEASTNTNPLHPWHLLTLPEAEPMAGCAQGKAAAPALPGGPVPCATVLPVMPKSMSA